MGGLVWQRIEAELKRRKKNQSWLAAQLGMSRARIANWKARGVPPEHYGAIAVLFGESIDWVAGASDERRPDAANLSPMARRLGQEFDQIEDPRAQADVFAKAITLMVRAREDV